LQTHYNVVFFDEKDVTRAWLTPGAMRPFTGQENSKEFKKVSFPFPHKTMKLLTPMLVMKNTSVSCVLASNSNSFFLSEFGHQ
jgi:hypothetical protein